MMYVGSANIWESLHGFQRRPLSTAGAFPFHGRAPFGVLSSHMSAWSQPRRGPCRKVRFCGSSLFPPWELPPKELSFNTGGTACAGTRNAAAGGRPSQEQDWGSPTLTAGPVRKMGDPGHRQKAWLSRGRTEVRCKSLILEPGSEE